MLRHSASALVLALSLAAAVPAGAQSPKVASTPAQAKNNYSNGDSWLCRPGRRDACAIDLSTTVVAASGKLTREEWKPNPNPDIDCFYVYPTVSNDPTGNSDMIPGPEEKSVIRAQFARFGSVCRVYAPLYRQITLTALRSMIAGKAIPFDRALAYNDVLDAWNYYLEHDNKGRGVVLIGHSQGSGVLTQLIKSGIDGKPVQPRIVSALLLGTNLPVPQGKDVGGAFQNIPLCHSATQTGCVITYASFRANSPPPANSRFGRVTGEKMMAACTNPAALGGGSGELHPYLGSRGSGVVSSEAPPRPWVTPPQPIDTPFVNVPGLLTAECVSNEKGSYLAVSVHGNPEDPRTDDIPGDVVAGGQVLADWGLHLIDVNLAMGNLVEIVGQQGKAYSAAGQVRVDGGLVEGAHQESGIRVFKGIPFAAPPVGDLRWQAPHPVTPWKGVRKATEFGARCMQGPIFPDMVFRDGPPSEDCLYLNVWTPAKSSKELLPVMVWIYGGGFQAGSASEPRQDGENMAKKGVIVVSMNYRLGVFGFLAHPDLTKESGHNASGNYGLMDQAAALEWVHKNIAAFGGDPSKVTIFGESAGSFSVSALMASPMARGLFQRAIGESGAFFSAGDQPLGQRSLGQSEKAGSELAASLGAKSITELRAKPAADVLQAALKAGGFRFSPNIDGHFLPADVPSIYAQGKQRHVPLLAGWNADEARAFVVLAKQKPTVQSFTDQMRSRFKDKAGAALQVYPAASDEEALESAASFAGDSFIGYATWKWIEMQRKTGDSPVYRYSFDKAPPVPPETKINGMPATARDIGARHAGEIEYVFSALKSSPNVPWEPGDWKLSDIMTSYWTNFAKTGNPNGPGLPEWPRYDQAGGFEVLHLNVEVHAARDEHRDRYEFLDAASK